MKAKKVPWSSVVGQQIMVMGSSGECVGTLSVRPQNTGEADPRTCAEALADTLVERINAAQPDA